MDPRLTPAMPAGGALGLHEASSTLPQAVAPNDAALAAPGAPDSAYQKKASEAAVKFEAFFIGHMLKQMRSSTKELAADDSIYKDSINNDMLDMADNLVADQMANQRAFGIADAILRQLLPAAPAPVTRQPAPAPASPSAQNISTKS